MGSPVIVFLSAFLKREKRKGKEDAQKILMLRFHLEQEIFDGIGTYSKDMPKRRCKRIEKINKREQASLTSGNILPNHILLRPTKYKWYMLCQTFSEKEH